MVEQHARLALRMTDQAIGLVRGRIAIQRSSRELLDQPALLDEILTVRGGEAARGHRGDGEE
jgi:ABC-type branched-subunit amino acid transport system ATPase component